MMLALTTCIMPEMAAHALPLQYSAQKITLASRVLQEALVAFALFVLVFATIRSDPDPIRSDPKDSNAERWPFREDYDNVINGLVVKRRPWK
jgi:hypothetical protein